jgi:RNA polymerase sigma factor (sigma-70 family)
VGSSNADEAAVIRRSGRDPAAFEVFYRRHVAEVGRFIARRVDDPHAVADLTAEVFLQVIDAAAGYRGGQGGPRGWLYGIARNVVASFWRDTERRQRREVRIAGHRLLDGAELLRIEERIDAARQVAAISPGLAALPDGERAVLELVGYDGLSVAEAAAVLGIRPGAARVRLHRARRAVRAATPPPPKPAPAPARPIVPAPQPLEERS